MQHDPLNQPTTAPLSRRLQGGFTLVEIMVVIVILGLLATMVATNFSAFTVFGTSGAGYRDGYAFFPIMGFGTGFMALTFWIIGRNMRQVGLEPGLVSGDVGQHGRHRPGQRAGLGVDGVVAGAPRASRPARAR